MSFVSVHRVFPDSDPPLQVNLTGNPIQCSCQTLGVLHFISLHRRHFAQLDNYSCLHGSPGYYVTFDRLDDVILSELDFDCSKGVALIVAGSLTALALLLTATAVFCYRYRWEVCLSRL